MRTKTHLFFIGLGAALLLARCAGAQVLANPVEDNLRPDLVVLRDLRTDLRVGERVVSTKQQFHVYRVERVEGKRLWLSAERATLKGWAPRADVVPLKSAAHYFTLELKKDPRSARLHYLRGQVFLETGTDDRAVADLSEAIRIEPAFAEAYAARGKVRVSLRDYKAALNDFDTAIRLAPRSAEVFFSRIYLWAAMEKAEPAVADCSEAIRRDPSNAYLYSCRASIRHRRLRDPDLALADYDESLRIDPTQADSFNNRGVIWQESKNFERAEADFSEAIRLQPNRHDFYSNRAAARFSRRDYEKSISDCDIALRLNPESPFAYFTRGQASMGKGDHDHALADFAETIRRSPEFFLAYYYRARIWKAREDYARTLADLNQVVELSPTMAPFADAQRIWIWDTCRDRRFRNAHRAIERARFVDKRLGELPNGGETLGAMLLAVAFAEAGDFQSAIQHQNKAIRSHEQTGRESALLKRIMKSLREHKSYQETKSDQMESIWKFF